MAKRIKKQAKSRLLKVEALEQRQLLAGGFTSAQGQEFSDIVHPNGNVYDQVLLKSSSINVINDPGQVTRVSFLDQQGDIVQVEFGGSGTLSISLDASTFKSGVAPTNYNQSNITYVQGLASITISGSDATTNLNVFTVGSATAVNQALFDSTHTGGNNQAEIQRVTIVANPANPNGSTFGSIFAGNVNFTGSSGPVGITAANVQVQGVVTIGDINATGTATPTLIFGTASQFGTVTVAGGDLLSPNGLSINNNGSYLYTINETAGTLSNGTTLAAQNTYSQMSFTGANPVTATTKTFTLTSGVDSITGTTGNDVINGQIGASPTLTALDSIDGAGGNDSLNINDVSGNTPLPGGITIKNVEVINLAAAGIANIDTSASTITGLTNLNVIASTGADTITAGAGQAVTVADTAGKVTLVGGSTQTVNTKGGVALSGASGAVAATDIGQGATASTIDGGTTVTLTNTADVSAANSGTITIGGTKAASGAVTVTTALTGTDAAYTTGYAGGAIAITGGSSVSVTETATPTKNPDATLNAGVNPTTTESAVTVNGNASTTSVTVAQSAASTSAATVTAVSGVAEVTSIQFGLLKAGDTMTIGNLALTPTTDLTGKQVAAAFANLSGAALGGISTGAASGTNSDTVVFTYTSTGAKADFTTAILTNTSTASVAPTISVTTQGVTSVSSAGRVGITPGAVTINDTNNTITSASLTNFGTTAITSKALTSLSLTNTSAGSGAGAVAGNVTLTNAAGATTLDLTVNGGSNGFGTITDANNTYTTLKAHVAGSTTIATITDTSLAGLTVDGTATLTLTNAVPSLKTITVSGSAGLSVGTILSNTNTASVDASGTTGNVSVIVDPTFTTVTGGAGNDTVSINGVPTKTIAGGAGTDTLTINATAATFSNPSANTFISGFETLGLGAAANGTYDATGFAGLTTGAIAAASGFSNVAAGTTLNVSANPGFQVTYALKDATGGSDSLTVTQRTDRTTDIAAAGIETVTYNLSTNSSGSGSISLTDTAVTSLTVNSGNRAVTVATPGATALTSVNFGTMSGAVTYTLPNGAVATVTGGSAGDTLSAGTGTNAVTLIGGAGDDTLTANSGLATLTGGSGNDTFVVPLPGANVNTYSTITDFSTGDVLRVGANLGAETFSATKITLANTAVFQDYANAVVAAGGDASTNGYIGWFQFNGDTYVVESRHNGTTTPSFVNGTDIVVKITGVVDLSTTTLVYNGGLPEIVLH